MSTEDLLVALAARGLDTSAGIDLDEPLDPVAWAAFHGLVREHRLTGMLAMAVADGTFPVTAEQDREAADVELRYATHVVTLERLLLDIADRLDAAGVEHRVLKGPAYAHTAYPVPELRPFADLDLLVRGDALDRAGRVLDDLGATRRVPELRPGFDRRFGRTVTRATRTGHEVDVHRTLASGAFTFLVDADGLFERRATFELAGRPLDCFDPTLALLHCCVHLVLGGRPPLLAVRDVAQHVEHPDLDGRALVVLAGRWRLSAVVAAGVHTARAELRLPEHWAGDLRDALHPTAEERRLLATFPPTTHRAEDQAVHSLRHIPGVRSKSAYALALAWPASDNLRHRGLTRASHLRELARRAAGRAGRARSRA